MVLRDLAILHRQNRTSGILNVLAPNILVIVRENPGRIYGAIVEV